jgi:hypothetical protein
MENTASNSTCTVARGSLPSDGSSSVAYLRSCYITMADISFVTPSLPSSGSISHNIFDHIEVRPKKNFISSRPLPCHYGALYQRILVTNV